MSNIPSNLTHGARSHLNRYVPDATESGLKDRWFNTGNIGIYTCNDCMRSRAAPPDRNVKAWAN